MTATQPMTPEKAISELYEAADLIRGEYHYAAARIQEAAYAIPDTHCVVPRLVTNEMVIVAEEAYADWCSDNQDTLVPNVHEVPLRFAIQAMLNAAEVGDE